jgi:hypothetical protein
MQTDSTYTGSLHELDESSPAADDLTGCDIVLRPHQRTLLHRCLMIEQGPVQLADIPLFASLFMDSARMLERHPHNHLRTRVGIIGDKAGSGKSFVMLAIVQAGREGPARGLDPVVSSVAGNRVALSVRQQVAELGLSLLVVPHNLCVQWRGYVERFGGGLKHAFVSRSRDLPALREPGALEAIDLLVVTSTFHNSVAGIIGKRCIRRVLYDEADSLTIPCCVAVDAGFHWFATASYRNMLSVCMPSNTGVRSSGFIKNTFAGLRETSMSRAFAYALVVKNGDAFVDNSLRLPEPSVRFVRCKTPLSLRVLNGLAERAVIDSLNAGDVPSALMHICPANRDTEDNIVSVLMEKLERQAHNLGLHAASVQEMAFDGGEEARAAEAARVGNKLAELRGRMECIRERVKGADMCCICYEEIANKTVVPCCSNAFCFSCINKWIFRVTRCPLCKAELKISNLLVVTSKEEELPLPPPPPPGPGPHLDKLQNLEQILVERCATPGASKVLVFSSFDNAFADIVSMLTRVGLRHRFLKGNLYTVAGIERDYRQGGLDVLLVNTSNYGSGLNFENTTDVVMLHKFDTEVEHQVIGRAQRCGRETPLNVWYLLHETE